MGISQSITPLPSGLSGLSVSAKRTGCSITQQKVPEPALLFSETAKLNNLRPYYYFRYILTELPKYCDKKGNIDPAKLDQLMPWAEELPEECRKPRRS